MVNLNREPIGDAVYVGRRRPSHGLAGSDFANPYRIGRDGTREEVIEKYRRWLAKQPDLLQRLHELHGRRLACWCAPEPCHGDVLVAFADAAKLLDEINAAGITASVHNGRVRLTPASRVSDALVARARPHKDALRWLVAQRQADRIPAEKHVLVAYASKVFDARIVKVARPSGHRA